MKAAINQLLEQMRSGDESTKIRAACEVRDHHRATKDRRVIAAVVRLLRDEDNTVRSFAAHALGRLGGKRVLNPLFASMVSRKHWNENATANAIADTGLRSAVPRLIELLRRHQRGVVRHCAVIALGRMKAPAAFEPLAEAILGDSDLNVRREAAVALGVLGNPAALPPLIKALDEERDRESYLVREFSAYALRMLSDVRARPALEKRLAVETEGKVVDALSAAISQLDHGSAQNPPHEFIPEFNFETFFVTSANEHAHCGALDVAEEEIGRGYFLYLYGPRAHAGEMRHLLRAIVRAKGAKGQSLRDISAEEFAHRLREARAANTLPRLQAHYHADCLLVEGVQKFLDSPDVVEDFVAVVKALQKDGRHVVTTADRHPSRLGQLGRRLEDVSRMFVIAGLGEADLKRSNKK